MFLAPVTCDWSDLPAPYEWWQMIENAHIDGLVQERRNPSVIARVLHLPISSYCSWRWLAIPYDHIYKLNRIHMTLTNVFNVTVQPRFRTIGRPNAGLMICVPSVPAFTTIWRGPVLMLIDEDIWFKHIHFYNTAVVIKKTWGCIVMSDFMTGNCLGNMYELIAINAFMW